MNVWVVITSINPPTAGMEAINRICCRNGWHAVLVGDVASPADWSCGDIEFLSLEKQNERFPEFSRLVPLKHYSRKNLGYLYAIRNGADAILETDDDNIPYDNVFGSDLSTSLQGHLLRGDDWVNVYRHYTDALIWPRGLPLDAIHISGKLDAEAQTLACPVQQFLADEDPDVDAIYRLLFKAPLVFRKRTTAVVPDIGVWSPFNTQNTLIHRSAFPLLYLPCFVSFRMTDIWRSFVMQQGVWLEGGRVAFRDATVRQERNEHDLMRDFGDEIVGYTQNRRLCACLAATAATLDAKNLSTSQIAFRLWSRLIDEGIVPETEMAVMKAWTESFL